MLRTFIKLTRTEERAALLIRAITLLEENNYLTLVDQIEATAAGEEVSDNQITIAKIEDQLGEAIASVYAAHSIHIRYDQNQIGLIIDLLEFLLNFGTEKGHTPELGSVEEIYELADTNEGVLAALFDNSGHNISFEPLDFVVWVGLTFIKSLERFVVDTSNDRVEEEHGKLLQGDDLENFKKFGSLFPEALAVKHCAQVRGVESDLNHLLFTYDQVIGKLGAKELAVELVGFVIISKTPETTTKGNYAISLVEQVSGQGNRALEVINMVKQTIDKVGLK